MALCPRCKKPNLDGTRMCAACGSPLSPSGPSVAGPLPTRRPRVLFRVVRADGGPESTYSMTAEVLSCGRQADVPLPADPFVAAVQARFYFSGGRLAVEDVGGGNGVFVRLKSEREVATGGEVRVGRQRLLLEPMPPTAPGVGGAQVWGSPDPGYRLRLVQLLEGGGRGAAFPLKEGENTLGREVGDLTFPTDGFVSGRHALFQARGDRLSVRDAGSSNGTFLRLLAPTFIEDADQLLIGRELVRIEVS